MSRGRQPWRVAPPPRYRPVPRAPREALAATWSRPAGVVGATWKPAAAARAERARARRRAAARAEAARRASIRSVCAQILDRERAEGDGRELDARKVLEEVRRWYRVQPRPAAAAVQPRPAAAAAAAAAAAPVVVAGDRASPARPRPPGTPPLRRPPAGAWPRDESSPPAPARRKGPSVAHDIEAGRRRLLRSVGVAVRARAAAAAAAAPGPTPAPARDVDALFRALA